MTNTHTLHPPTSSNPYWLSQYQMCRIEVIFSNFTSSVFRWTISGGISLQTFQPHLVPVATWNHRGQFETLMYSFGFSRINKCLFLLPSIVFESFNDCQKWGGMNEWSVVFGHRATSAGELERFYIWWIKSLWWSCVNFVMITFIGCYEGIKVKRKL